MSKLIKSGHHTGVDASGIQNVKKKRGRGKKSGSHITTSNNKPSKLMYMYRKDELYTPVLVTV